jgi:hypothetical protein
MNLEIMWFDGKVRCSIEKNGQFKKHPECEKGRSHSSCWAMTQGPFGGGLNQFLDRPLSDAVGLVSRTHVWGLSDHEIITGCPRTEETNPAASSPKTVRTVLPGLSRLCPAALAKHFHFTKICSSSKGRSFFWDQSLRVVSDAFSPIFPTNINEMK